MQPDRRGIAQLNYLLLASLLLHLAILFAIGSGSFGKVAPQSQSSAMVLDYLEPGGSKEERKAQVDSRRFGQPGLPAAGSARSPEKTSVPSGAIAGVPPASPQHEVRSGSGAPIPTPALPLKGRESGASTRVIGGTETAGGAHKPVDTWAGNSANSAAGTDAKGARANFPGSTPGVTGARAGAAGALTVRGAGRSSGVPGVAIRGEGGSPGRGAYQAKLKSLVEAHKEYPLAARRSGREGSCQRRFVLGRDGSLKRVESLSSCGHPFLDSAATQAIVGVGTFPPLPEEYPGAEEGFTITMTFTLTKK